MPLSFDIMLMFLIYTQKFENREINYVAASH